MPEVLGRLSWNSENTFPHEWKQAQPASSPMSMYKHKKQILDKFRQRLESESQETNPACALSLAAVDGSAYVLTSPEHE
jgi:hypothetical protein